MNSTDPKSARQLRKQEILTILDSRDWESLRRWIAATRSPLTTISTILFSTEPLRCWRAIEATGIAAEVVAKTNLETVRNLIRHNFWMMNDESGNVGWYAPETIGEILYHVPTLISEYAPQLPSFFVEEPFERGAYWAVARLASTHPSEFDDIADKLARSTRLADPAIRYRALLALSFIDANRAKECATEMAGDEEVTREYDLTTGGFIDVKVSDLAASVLNS